MDPKQPSDDRSLSVPSRDSNSGSNAPDRQAATQLMRQQIDQLYSDQESAKAANNTETTHHSTGHQAHSAPTNHNTQLAHQWQNYHTQWQKYYQQYYERYYLHQLNKRQQQMAGQVPQVTQQAAMVTAGEPEPETLTRDQAVSELRENLVGKIREHSGRVRSSRHFMPVALALTVALVFGILQYNRLIVAQVKAYVSPGSISPANLVVDPTTDIKVSTEPKIIIPKINVDAPVVYDVPSIEEHVVQEKLKSGVVHYPIPGASSLPGQQGNTVILGHSSNDVFDDGGYKFVFVQLDKLDKGDTFYLNYQGTRYTYSVTDKKIINPNEVGTLVINNGKPLATLVTCTPPGTALKRLVIFAEQISPDPDKATTAAATGESSGQTDAIPGNSPTLFERLFGQ
jgi:sortase A